MEINPRLISPGPNGKDTYTNQFGFLANAYFFYVLDHTTMVHPGNNSLILGHSPYIKMLYFNPFIDTRDDNLSLWQIDYDTKPAGDPVPNKEYAAQVFRVYGFGGAIPNSRVYDLHERNVWNDKISNESKLNFYPYRFYKIVDGFNQPLDLRPELIPNGDLKIKVKTSIAEKCVYTIFAEGYKGDMDGNREGLVNQASFDYPVASTAYSQFWATSQAQFQTNREYALKQNDRHFAQGMWQNAANLTTNLIKAGSEAYAGAEGAAGKSLASAGGNIVDMFMASSNRNFSKQEIEAKAMSQISDLSTTPRSFTSNCSSPFFNVTNNNFKMKLIEYRIKDEYIERLEQYFKKYGYKVNNYMKPNLRNRFYYNYIKMSDCNITADRIPKEELQALKAMFEKGLTIWHVDRAGVNPLEYPDPDNHEV